MLGALIALALAGGPDEKGLYFGAPGGTVTVPELALADGPVTVEFRFKTLEKLKGTFRVVSQAGRFHVALGASGKVDFGLIGDIPKTVSARAAWKDGKWTHVACVWDGAEAAIYVDGKKAAGEKIEGFGKLATSKAPLVIGHAADPKIKSKDFFEGFLSDVAVWNAAVSTPATLSGKEPNLAGFWALRGKADGLSPSLERAGWCRTSWWFDEKPDRPYLHLFGYDAGLAGATRAILVDNESKGDVGVLWQDKTDVKVTWVDPGLGEPRTSTLKSLPGAALVCGAADAKGNVYYLMVESTAGDRVKASMFLAAADGKPLKEVPVDTTQGGWNIYNYGGRWVGSMTIAKDSGCLIIPRTMHMGGDGLRHQGAIAVTFPPDLSKFQNHGQTSGHSFGNLLTQTRQGEFLGLDLGDNYPRGVHLHRISNGARTSRVLYTYKTAHGTSARNGSPPYPEISGNGKSYFKWSNDNGTYTELGGVAEGKMSYSVIFATDRSPEGKVLDNSRIGIANEPRDVAMLRVIKNFEKAPGGSEVSDAIMAGPVPGAKPETGGFFDFGGRWQAQRVTGVLWLTNYPSGEAAHAPQLFPRKDGTITVLWEKTGGTDAGLHALTVEESGKKLGEVMRLAPTTLARETLPIRVGDRLFTLTKDGLAFIND
ncbi:MAG TPA: LamG domain-containing protein [Planctomycetota bacterium]